MEWSIIAIQGVDIGRICFSIPRPKRNVQLITDVKLGIQFNDDSGVFALNKLRIRGILR